MEQRVFIMLISRKSGLIAVALGAGLAFTAQPLPAAAQEQQPTWEQPTQPQPAWDQPPPTEAEGPWGEGLYYLLDFSIGDSKNPNTSADFGVDLDWSTGFGLGIGYRVNMLRVEGEFSSQFYRVGSLDLGVAPPFPAADYAGGMHAQNAMANIFIDLPAAGQMRPYLGIGAGFAWVSAEYNESVCIIFCFSTTNQVVDDWDRVSARQAMLGASFAGDSSNLEWFVGYRYYETDDLNYRTSGGTAFVQDGIKDHSIMGGFRFLVD